MFAFIAAASLNWISDRANFWSEDNIERVTQMMVGNQQVPVDFQQFAGKRVLLLVHGFNNSASEAQATYHEIFSYLDGFDLYDAVLGYFWPGYGNPLAYYFAKDNAEKLSSRMTANLNALAAHAQKVDVMAHSMGNLILLRALSKTSTTPVQNFYSLAAAVDEDSIEKRHSYYSATQQCKDLYVFHSDEDEALRIAFKIAEFDEALGEDESIDLLKMPKNVQFIDCTSFVDGHSGYFKKRAEPVYLFIQKQQTANTPASTVIQKARLLVDGSLEKES
jgi:esterase/lipase superfamily enzyme